MLVSDNGGPTLAKSAQLLFNIRSEPDVARVGLKAMLVY